MVFYPSCCCAHERTFIHTPCYLKNSSLVFQQAASPAPAVAMPPKKKAAKPGSPSSSSQGGSPATSPAAARSLNGSVLERLHQSVTFIKDIPYFADITGHLALGIKDGASLQPFDPDSWDSCDGTYLCNGNLFWLDLVYSVSGNVPVNRQSVELLMSRYFTDPTTKFPDKVIVGIIGKPSGNEIMASKGSLVRISPDEVIIAWVLSAARDLMKSKSEDRIALWQRAALSVPMEFVSCENVQSRYFKSVNLRESVGTDFAALHRTPVQRIFELISWKTSQERANGKTMSVTDVADTWQKHVQTSVMSEKITAGYIDTALTVYDRILSIEQAAAIVLDAEERWGVKSPWDSVYKLEVVIKKCGRPSPQTTKRLLWVLGFTTDAMLDLELSPGQLSVRSLSGKGQPGNKGLVDFWLYKGCLLTHLTDTFLSELNLPSEVKTEIRGYFKSPVIFRNLFGYKTENKPRQWLAKYSANVHKLIFMIADRLGDTGDIEIWAGEVARNAWHG